MFTLNPFEKSAEEPIKLSLDTIFDYADKDQAYEVIFDPNVLKSQQKLKVFLCL